MAEEKTYLELSEEEGVSHKFYEVVVDGTNMTIRYGRIGTDGTKKTSSFATPEKARAAANKKINAKKRKGYEPAVMGVRKKRAITRRAIQSTRSSAKKAPVLWKFATGRSAFGIFIDDQHCWVGNESGEVYCLNHNAEVLRQYKLPDGVKCIVSDGDWLYAGCDDGKVYDLTGKMPRVAYEIDESVDIFGGSLLACAAACSFALSLLERRGGQGADGAPPPTHEVLSATRHAALHLAAA